MNMKKQNDNTQMATTRKGLWHLLMGLVVIVSGFILMMGGAPEDPEVFNWSIFDNSYISFNLYGCTHS